MFIRVLSALEAGRLRGTSRMLPVVPPIAGSIAVAGSSLTQDRGSAPSSRLQSTSSLWTRALIGQRTRVARHDRAYAAKVLCCTVALLSERKRHGTHRERHPVDSHSRLVRPPHPAPTRQSATALSSRTKMPLLERRRMTQISANKKNATATMAQR